MLALSGCAMRFVFRRVGGRRVTLAWRIAVFGAIASGPAASAEAQLRVEPATGRFWVASAALVSASLLLDEPLRDVAARNQSPRLDDVARAIDPLGRAQYLVPALVGAYLVPRLAGAHRFSDAALRVGLGYAAADGIESILKPVVGRRRPDAGGGSLAFRPFSSSGAWHSFPSAHTVHAFAIAAGVADEARRPWVSAAAYGTAALVGAQRVYTRAHWASDVAASAVLAIGASTTTTAWLRRHGLGRLLPPVGGGRR